MGFQIAGQKKAIGSIGSNFERARGEFGTNFYDPYSQTGAQANTAYANSIGLNGPSGNLAALGQFQAGPGYGWAQQQGADTIARQAAARGTLSGGGTSADLTRFGIGLGNQEFGGWQDRLRALGAQGLQAAGGQTGRQGNLAGISTGQGMAEAGIYQHTADQLADQYNQGLDRQSQSDQAGQRNLMGLIGGGLDLATAGLFPQKALMLKPS